MPSTVASRGSCFKTKPDDIYKADGAYEFNEVRTRERRVWIYVNEEKNVSEILAQTCTTSVRDCPA